MTTQPTGHARPALSTPPTARWQATPAQNLVTLLLGFWLMTGIFVDGWAHNHLGERLETFFTPWHAVFYSGFLAVAVWTAWLGRLGLRLGHRGVQVLPDGYGLGAAGVVVFALGGLGDMTWHTLFGIEVGIDALLSPTHLLLFLGAQLLIVSPLVSCWRHAGGRTMPGARVWPAVLSATAALSFTSFMHMYAWTLVSLPAASSFDGARSFVASTLLTSMILTAPVLLLLLRWDLPFGTVTLMFTVNTVLMRGMTVGLTEDTAPLLVMLGAGLTADVLMRALRPSPTRRAAYRTFAALLPLTVWVPYLTLTAADRGASLELWTGACFMAALGGLALSTLTVPPALPGTQPAEP